MSSEPIFPQEMNPVTLVQATETHVLHDGLRAVCGVLVRKKDPTIFAVPTLQFAQDIMDTTDQPCSGCADYIDTLLWHQSLLNHPSTRSASRKLSLKGNQ